MLESPLFGGVVLSVDLVALLVCVVGFCLIIFIDNVLDTPAAWSQTIYLSTFRRGDLKLFLFGELGD